MLVLPGMPSIVLPSVKTSKQYNSGMSNKNSPLETKNFVGLLYLDLISLLDYDNHKESSTANSVKTETWALIKKAYLFCSY